MTEPETPEAEAPSLEPTEEELASAKAAGQYTEDYGIWPRCSECGERVEPSTYSQHVNAHMGRGAEALGAGLDDA